MIGIGNIQQFGGGGGGVASAVAFPDVTGNPLDNTALQPYLSSVTNLENNEFKYLYFEAISSTSGVITKPQNSTILLGDIESLDALVETIQSGRPTGNSPKTSGGSPVVVTSFDVNGNYVLSGVPSAYPVAILYVFKTKGKDVQYVNLNNVIADEQVGVMIGAGASNDGKSGEVPKPVLGDQNKVLAGNGLWRTIVDLLGYTPQNQAGLTGGSFPSTGKIGEILSWSGNSGAISNGVWTTLHTYSLPAGNWKIWGWCYFNVNSSIPSVMVFNTSKNALSNLGLDGMVAIYRTGVTGNGDQISTPPFVFSQGASANIYASVYYGFTGTANGTVTWKMFAERLS